MLRLLDYLMGGLALLALPFLLWWGIYQSPQSAVNLQARLEAGARAALAQGGADWASVNMEGQRAVLTGAAPSSDAVREAARLVRRSSGPGGVIFGGVTQVESRAEAAPPVSPYVWRAVKTGEGRIVLSGHVPSKTIQASLIEDARLLGRAAVDDEMVLAAGAPAGNFQGLARFALGQLALLEEGEAVISDYRLVLKGEVGDPKVRAEMMTAISRVAAPYRGVPVLTGEPYWLAEHSGNVLTLSGNVGSEAQRRLLLEAAAGFEGEIADTMQVTEAAGPEGWLDGARAGLPQFLKFRSGRMAFDEAAGAFLFQGEASPSTLYYLKEDMARSTGRWKTILGADMIQLAPEASGLVSAASAGGADLPCEAQLQAAMAAGEIAFTGDGAAIAPESGPVLDQIAGVALGCDRVTRFEISAASSVQASQIADFLVLAGVPRARLAAISYGPPQGQGANQTGEAGGAPIRPAQIRVVERSGE